MKKRASNKALLDRKRFQFLENQKTQYLEKLTLEESVRIFESLTSNESMEEFSQYFSHNTPVCLKIGLNRDLIKRSI